ncbi:SET and MYND domain-containing protein 4-like isoform X1 [Daphnia pulex]|uniref:SET and MYND domain-containing protein 4-like isoform X1 n=1 Tax=Daphnia pulex TaxID=6669 RepID=UPI001EDF434F|nr:SET and MYND domain-containing protein 4-like isoform X1 [Daphnia pulex]XP_046441018.1 SET and MYND domain-containing protein 4-like isoform X1 [Daphnia pulex]XP_046441019.1 SET and MYND domain-containing protein 4-like isoform X1 [Daphnia pulex]XP_046441020.1 SET and MYND domain-containing protein 4-like isoform X1 [Daphnia pulex]XP_046441021.1 SET and MYND domain-containing protein 4-like isoform X1 [Daphnia pulex]
MEEDDNFGEKNGFFKTYHLSVLKKLCIGDLAGLSACRNDEERLVYVHSLPYVHEVPHEMSSAMGNSLPSSKSATVAQKKRTEGNEFFKKKDYPSAVRLYSEAVSKAPTNITNESGEPQLAMAFANRSAALFHLAEFARALVDIDQALSSGYPAELRYKLAERQAKCLMALGKPADQVIAACESAMKDVNDSRLDPAKRDLFVRDIKLLMEESKSSNRKIPESASSSLIQPKRDNGKKCPPEIVGGRNIEHPSFSKKILVEEDAVSGRYGVAAAPIRVGDVIAVDAPYASVMNPEKFSTHCHHCYQILELGEVLPCSHCDLVSFCSVNCRSRAMESYHATECPILSCLYTAGISIICYLSLRMIAIHPPSFFMDVRPVIEQPELQKKAALSEDVKKYIKTYHLVTHDTLRNKESFFHVTLMANFLLKCLKVAGYFGTRDTTDLKFSGALSDQERWIGSLLLRHLQILQFNAHEVSELRMDRPGCMEGAKTFFLGAGVYSTVALLNHSCEPGVIRHFIGDVMVVRAIKSFQPGEMVNENYGPIFTQKRRVDRQRSLKDRYWFDCRCNPCTENWPLIGEMTDEALRFRCADRRCRKPLVVQSDTMTPFIICPSCKKSNNILKSLQALQDTEESFNRGNELIDQGNFAGALECCLQTMSKLDDILCPPYRDYIQCQERARRCILTLGNVIYAPDVANVRR